MRSKRLISMIVLSTSLFCMKVNADVNEDVRNAQLKYEEYQKKIDEINFKIYSLNGDIEKLVASIDETNKKVAETENEIKFNEVKIEDLKKDIEVREKVKDSRVRELYKSNTMLVYTNLIFSAKNFSELITVLDSVNRLVNLDKSVLFELEEDKKVLNEKILDLEGKKKDLDSYKRDLVKEQEEIEVKKKEQEEIVRNVESEKYKFGNEVLAVAEKELVKYQLDTIATSNDIGTLTSLVSQLVAIRDNQLSVDSVIQEVNSAISNANTKIANINAEVEASRIQESTGSSVQSSIQVNRGSSGSCTGQDIVNYAYQFLGKYYVWGAVGPEVFDCSGLTSYVYRHAAGVEITRTTYTQINVGTPVSQNSLQPGDLVFTYDNEHVGIYVGNGMYINATYPGSTVRVTPVTNFYAARRIL